MESFYGGRRGTEFTIVKPYKTINEMINDFKNGGDFTEVNYGEWVIIDTETKDDPDNGKIYQRGFDYSNNLGGAVYKGQIVGSSGKTPEIFLAQQDNIDSKLEEIGQEFQNEPELDRGHGTYEGKTTTEEWRTYPGYDPDTDDPDYIDGHLDNVKYSYYTLRDEKLNIYGCYMGFKFPRHVIDLESEEVDSHTPASISNVTLDEEGKRLYNFYDKWHICVPKGIHGADFEGLNFLTKDNSIWSLRRDYTSSEEGEQTSTWLCDLKDVESITFDESVSKFLITYSTYYKNSLGEYISEEGAVVTEANKVKIKKYIEQPIKYILNAYVDEVTKQLTIVYSTYGENGEHEQIKIGDPISFIEGIEIDKQTKRFKITYNTYHEDENGEKINDSEYIGCPIRYIVDIKINEDNQKIHVVYNTPKTQIDEQGNTVYDENGDPVYLLNDGQPIIEEDIGDPVKYIDKIEYNEQTCKIEVYYNTNKNEAIEISPSIKYIDHMAFNTDTSKVEAYYNTAPDTPIPITNAINDIVDIVMTNTSHLYVKYSDPDKQGQAVYNNVGGYVDLGYVRGGGLQVYDVLSFVGSDEEVKEQLTHQYASVLPDGWAIAVKDTDPTKEGTKYWILNKRNNPPEWKYFGSNSASEKDVVLSSSEPTTLSDSGIWLISESRSVYAI